jgi:hypothetical protein
MVAMAAHKAFSDKWLGDSHHLLANLMTKLRKPPTDPKKYPYNHSISIIQSSGMGKSRLVDAVAENTFCFPFNIHEPASRHRLGNVLESLTTYTA